MNLMQSIYSVRVWNRNSIEPFMLNELISPDAPWTPVSRYLCGSFFIALDFKKHKMSVERLSGTVIMCKASSCIMYACSQPPGGRPPSSHWPYLSSKTSSHDCAFEGIPFFVVNGSSMWGLFRCSQNGRLRPSVMTSSDPTDGWSRGNVHIFISSSSEKDKYAQ